MTNRRPSPALRSARAWTAASLEAAKHAETQRLAAISEPEESGDWPASGDMDDSESLWPLWFILAFLITFGLGWSAWWCCH